MSEARELFETFAEKMEEAMRAAERDGLHVKADIFCRASWAAREALATQPGAVPDLPEWLELDEHEDWRVTFEGGHRFWIDPSLPPDDLDRIAEACTKLAARERARRAGS